MSVSDIAETIAVMRMKEVTTYRCSKYLPTSSEKVADHVDEECRVKMTEWCFQVVEFCNFNREVVGIGMSYLDRYLCTPQGQSALENRKLFQLAAMCSLYMAAKLFETREMDLTLLSQLSRGVYSETEIAEMEKDILNALKWMVHPPTSVSFIHECFRALPSLPLHPETFAGIVELSRAHTELAVRDYAFVTLKPSSIAVASVVNTLGMLDCIPSTVRETITSHISQVTEIDLNSPEILEALSMLRNSWEKSRRTDMVSIVQTSYVSSEYCTEKTRGGSSSPVCVSRYS